MKSVTHNNIIYTQAQQEQGKHGFCEGCAFSGKLKNRTNLGACAKFGSICKPSSTGMLIFIKDKQPENIETSTGQYSLF